MLKAINPADIMPPYGGAYSRAIEVPAHARLLFVAGQVGVARDGSVPKGIAAQSEQLWLNVLSVLREGRMTTNDIVKLNVYVQSMEDFPVFAAVRKKYLGEHKPASLGVAVASLMDGLLVEMDVVAAAI